jgi:hypothetical protein
MFSLLMQDIGNEKTQVKMCAFLITLLQVSYNEFSSNSLIFRDQSTRFVQRLKLANLTSKIFRALT